ncbi:hypothetical protein K438DRAFT_1762835 [Mycena galopus ATCC 62051]|nr:hypothetical protein K438DRAFT_1762835 [Mycena galopus ATCC 62051]
MAPPSKTQVRGKKLFVSRQNCDENLAPKTTSDADDNGPAPPKPPPRSLKAQVTEKIAIISQLEARVSELEDEVMELREACDKAVTQTHTLLECNQNLSLTNTTLRSLKRKADATLSEQLTKKHKRVKRLEQDRDTKQDDTRMEISNLEDGLADKLGEIRQLRLNLAACQTQLQSQATTI